MLKADFNDNIPTINRPEASRPAPPFGTLLSDKTREQLSDPIAQDLKDWSNYLGIIFINADEISGPLREEIKTATKDGEISTSAQNRKIMGETFSQIRALLPDDIENEKLQTVSFQIGEITDFAQKVISGENFSQAIFDDAGKYSFGIVLTKQPNTKTSMAGLSGLPEETFEKFENILPSKAFQYMTALHEIGHVRFRSSRTEEEVYGSQATLIPELKGDDSSISYSILEESNADRSAIGHYLENADRLGLPKQVATLYEHMRAVGSIQQNPNYTGYFASIAAGETPGLPTHSTATTYDVTDTVQGDVPVDFQQITNSVLMTNQLADSLLGKVFFDEYKKYEKSRIENPEIGDDEKISPEEERIRFGSPLAYPFSVFQEAQDEGSEYTPMSDFDYSYLGATLGSENPELKYAVLKKLSNEGTIEAYAEHFKNPHLKEAVKEYLAGMEALAPDLIKTNPDLTSTILASRQSLPGPASMQTYLAANELKPGCKIDSKIICPSVAELAVAP